MFFPSRVIYIALVNNLSLHSNISYKQLIRLCLFQLFSKKENGQLTSLAPESEQHIGKIKCSLSWLFYWLFTIFKCNSWSLYRLSFLVQPTWLMINIWVKTWSHIRSNRKCSVNFADDVILSLCLQGLWMWTPKDWKIFWKKPHSFHMIRMLIFLRRLAWSGEQETDHMLSYHTWQKEICIRWSKRKIWLVDVNA